jgi:hypothetical protein
MELHPAAGPAARPGTPAGARAPAARTAVSSALASPELTGLSRQDLAALAASLELPWAAAREQRFHLARGHSRQARTGPAAPFRYTLETQLLAAICHHRLGMPCSHIAALLGAHYSTIAPAVQGITSLPGSGHPALAPGPVRVRTPQRPANSRCHHRDHHPRAPATRTQIAQQSTATHRKLTLFWNGHYLTRILRDHGFILVG